MSDGAKFLRQLPDGPLRPSPAAIVAGHSPRASQAWWVYWRATRRSPILKQWTSSAVWRPLAGLSLLLARLENERFARNVQCTQLAPRFRTEQGRRSVGAACDFSLLQFEARFHALPPWSVDWRGGLFWQVADPVTGELCGRRLQDIGRVRLGSSVSGIRLRSKKRPRSDGR